MNNLNYEGIRKAWINELEVVYTAWLDYIRLRKRTIIKGWGRKRRFIQFEYSDLIYNISVFFDSLYQIDKQKASVTKTSWLCESTNWPPDVAKAFWCCLRNPTHHLGRQSIYSDYDARIGEAKLFGGLHPNLDYDPVDRKKLNQDEIGSGWSVNMESKKITVLFYYPGIERVMYEILNRVTDKIKNGDRTILKGLYDLNITKFLL